MPKRFNCSQQECQMHENVLYGGSRVCHSDIEKIFLQWYLIQL